MHSRKCKQVKRTCFDEKIPLCIWNAASVSKKQCLHIIRIFRRCIIAHLNAVVFYTDYKIAFYFNPVCIIEVMGIVAQDENKNDCRI